VKLTQGTCKENRQLATDGRCQRPDSGAALEISVSLRSSRMPGNNARRPRFLAPPQRTRSTEPLASSLYVGYRANRADGLKIALDDAKLVRAWSAWRGVRRPSGISGIDECCPKIGWSVVRSESTKIPRRDRATASVAPILVEHLDQQRSSRVAEQNVDLTARRWSTTSANFSKC